MYIIKMVKPIIINSSNLVESDYNNVYTYEFPKGSVSFKDDSIALANLSIFYSWYNITSSSTYSRYGNNTFQYIWYGSTGASTHDVVIPDGNYEITDINSYFQSVMYANSHYLISGGTNVFFMELLPNATTGKVQFNSYPIPTSQGSYTLPSSWGGFPAIASTPQIVVQTNFDAIIGFSVGSFPSITQTTNYSIESSITPQISPINSITIACSVVMNDYSLPSTLLYSFAALGNTQFGSLLQVQPSSYAFVPINQGSFESLTVSFYDQEFRPVYIADTNLVLQLLIANKNDRFL